MHAHFYEFLQYQNEEANFKFNIYFTYTICKGIYLIDFQQGTKVIQFFKESPQLIMMEFLEKPKGKK